MKTKPAIQTVPGYIVIEIGKESATVFMGLRTLRSELLESLNTFPASDYLRQRVEAITNLINKLEAQL